jgi:Ctr copper transporter family
MDMTFSSGTMVTILFDPWMTTTTTQYAFSCIAVMVFGVVHHALMHARVLHRNAMRAKAAAAKRSAGGPKGAAFLSANGDAEGPACEECETPSEGRRFLFCLPESLFSVRYLPEAADALLYGLSLTVAYFNMLVIMIMNVGLFISVIVGEMLGYFIFSVLAGAYDVTTCHDA